MIAGQTANSRLLSSQLSKVGISCTDPLDEDSGSSSVELVEVESSSVSSVPDSSCVDLEGDWMGFRA